jgi:hypothetical protein
VPAYFPRIWVIGVDASGGQRDAIILIGPHMFECIGANL